MLRVPRIFLFFNTTREAQWLPSERFHLLSLHKTRSESPGAAPPQIFPILNITRLPRNAVTPQFPFFNLRKILVWYIFREI